MKTTYINDRTVLFASLVTLALMQSIHGVHAQSAWTTEAPLTTGNNAPAAAAINGTVYVAGGLNGSPLATMLAYNTTNNTWKSLASMPGGRYQNDGMGVISNKLYFPGGWTLSPPLPNNNLWVYDPVANSWDTTRAAMPQLSAGGVCGVISNKLYVTTPEDGYNGYYQFLDVYDPGVNTWTALASSPRSQIGPAYGVIGNNFYVAGGYDGANVTNVLDIYNPGLNTWSTGAPMLVSRSAPGSAVINGKLYVFGGYSAAGVYLNSVEVYDPSSNTWMSESNMPTSRSSPAAAAANGVAYVVGGGNSTNTALTTMEALTPTGASLSLFAGIWVSGLVGGTYEIEYQSSVSRTNWTVLADIVLSNSPTLFIDTNSPNYSARYYRAIFVP